MRENAGSLPRAPRGANDVQEVGVVALLLRRHTPGEALKAVLRGCEAGGPGLVREGRIGHDIVVSAKLLAVLELEHLSQIISEKRTERRRFVGRSSRRSEREKDAG